MRTMNNPKFQDFIIILSILLYIVVYALFCYLLLNGYIQKTVVYVPSKLPINTVLPTR